MKKFERLLKGHKYICFLDFEGTQFSHEMIALGAVVVSLDKKGRIKSKKLPYKVYVKAHNKIGKYVTELTGITEDQLKDEGVSFANAMESLKKYCGVSFSKCSFCTFGNHDMRILSQSIAYNFDFPREIVSQIQKNYIDFSAFISEFIKDDKGNPLSLIHYCEKFDTEILGPNHDPSSDAVNLCSLYDAFIKDSTIVCDEYKKVLGKFSRVPEPVKPLILKLLDGQNVSPNDLDDQIKKCLE